VKEIINSLVEIGVISTGGKAITCYEETLKSWCIHNNRKVIKPQKPQEVEADGEDEIAADHQEIHELKISSKKLEDIQTIFDYWNLYKGRKGWHGHNVISYDTKCVITESLQHYTTEDVCAAIDNYAKILLGGKYFWDHVWSLSSFLSVKHGSTKDSPKKWWQFLPENFVEENYLSDKPQKPQLEDADQNLEITKKLVKVFAHLINNKDFQPNGRQKSKFIEASKRMREFFERRKITEKYWIEYLTECLMANYVERGEVVWPGHLCSDNTWGILMPQYLIDLGIMKE
jgi:hypothetical protein